ncbi:UDP-glucose:glycoprotein glucosyltransferase 1 [Acipenser ruthenus]|uniref:UDP-glucose:glycoprotein glucosyltransferase 1 n=1 Tax=Acipenser ruthenus TaxID=7906 RepID=A0A444UPL3_ACIRT|nr:UDP-glucose:glycoprotein glucosyltransferase 1 [Acipenser ruthenus]
MDPEELETILLQRIVEATGFLQRSVFMGQLTDETDVEYLMDQPNVVPRINTRILSLRRSYLDLTSKPDEDIIYAESIWVIADFDMPSGRRLLSNALQHMGMDNDGFEKKHNNLAVDFIHTQQLFCQDVVKQLPGQVVVVINGWKILVINIILKITAKGIFYRNVLAPDVTFLANNTLSPGPVAKFLEMPESPLLTLNMITPESWLVEAVQSSNDLDNIHLQEIDGIVKAEYELEYLLLEGHCFDVTTGVTVYSGSKNCPHYTRHHSGKVEFMEIR